MKLNKKHKQTLQLIFERPTSATVKWNEVVSLIRALGGELNHRGKTSGSRIGIIFKERKAVLHKPHPANVMKKGSVESFREFLKSCGITISKMEGNK